MIIRLSCELCNEFDIHDGNGDWKETLTLAKTNELVGDGFYHPVQCQESKAKPIKHLGADMGSNCAILCFETCDTLQL